MTDYLVRVNARIDAEVTARVLVTEHELRQFFQMEPGDEIEREKIEIYAEEESDLEPHLEITSILGWKSLQATEVDIRQEFRRL